MKSKVLGVGLGSTIFIFLAIAVLALIRPVYVRLYGELSRIEEIACKKLEDETGLSLSYKSLSPSILAGANMKKIAISDVASKKTVLTIKKARKIRLFTYRIIMVRVRIHTQKQQKYLFCSP